MSEQGEHANDAMRDQIEADYDAFLDDRFCGSIRDAIEFMAEHPWNGCSLLRAEWVASLEGRR